MYLFERLTAVLAGRFYRFEHIVSYSSGKVDVADACGQLPATPREVSCPVSLRFDLALIQAAVRGYSFYPG